MQINKEVLKSLNPCADRYKHFLKHNASFDGSLSEFLDLPNLAYSDKVWVAEKVLTQNQAVSWATLCAESVVHMFEAKNTDDKILNNCINFLKTINDFDNLTDTEREEIEKHRDIIGDCCTARASRSAVRANYYALYAVYAANALYAVCAAVRLIADAAYNAVRCANYATSAAHYAANPTTYSVSDSTKNAAQQNQEELNIQFLKQVISL